MICSRSRRIRTYIYESCPFFQHFLSLRKDIFFVLISGVIGLIVDWKLAFLFFSITMTHLMMDSWSTDDGIMWLWPISSEQYSIFEFDSHTGGIYGFQFYARYVMTPRLVLPELIIISVGAFVIIRVIIQRYLSGN